jgi:hypothetical protein
MVFKLSKYSQQAFLLTDWTDSGKGWSPPEHAAYEKEMRFPYLVVRNLLPFRPLTGVTVASTVSHDPTLLIFFGSVLGLACQLDPTTLSPATKARPNDFWQRRPRLQPQFLTKNTGNECPPGCYSVIHS